MNNARPRCIIWESGTKYIYVFFFSSFFVLSINFLKKSTRRSRKGIGCQLNSSSTILLKILQFNIKYTKTCLQLHSVGNKQCISSVKYIRISFLSYFKRNLKKIADNRRSHYPIIYKFYNEISFVIDSGIQIIDMLLHSTC